jgi:hypothetical protein
MRNGFSSWTDFRVLAAAILAMVAVPSYAQPGGLIAPLMADQPIGYYIDANSDAAGFRPADAELCAWALADWVAHAQQRLTVEPVPEGAALIRVRFVSAQSGQYGEMRPIVVDGQRGAEVFIRPDTDALGEDVGGAARTDPLMRETIVYLTCLHELGHALGLEHTAVFEDVMYFFGFGGDIVAFFSRYRDRLQARNDIQYETGLSPGDITQLLSMYPPNGSSNR